MFEEVQKLVDICNSNQEIILQLLAIVKRQNEALLLVAGKCQVPPGHVIAQGCLNDIGPMLRGLKPYQGA